MGIGGGREEKWVEKGREAGRKRERWVRREKRVYGGGEQELRSERKRDRCVCVGGRNGPRKRGGGQGRAGVGREVGDERGDGVGGERSGWMRGGRV